MKIKLENLINFNDFKSIKETSDNESELLPEFNLNYNDKIEEIVEILNTNKLPDDITKEIVNDLRDVLLEMEQQGLVSTETTDELDEKHSMEKDEIDWQSWIIDVIQLPDFPTESVDKVYEDIKKFSGLEDDFYLPEDDLKF